jgi:hypothetical protein
LRPWTAETLAAAARGFQAAGFRSVRLLHRDEGMHSLVEACKPRA